MNSLECENLDDILTAVENLRKDSLISLAQVHSITFPLKCRVSHLRDIISNHFSRVLCTSGSSDACFQVQIAGNFSTDGNCKNI